MTIKNFTKLPVKMQHILICAIAVRNALEDIHAKHIPDTLMPELNREVRNGLMEAFTVLEGISDLSMIERKGKKEAMIQAFGWYIQMIPDYWELPKEYDLEKGITTAEEWLEAIKDVPSEKGQI